MTHLSWDEFGTHVLERRKFVANRDAQPGSSRIRPWRGKVLLMKGLG
ncbi:hypothetical protein ABH991_001333 [Bradyrhizobium ottawaense]